MSKPFHFLYDDGICMLSFTAWPKFWHVLVYVYSLSLSILNYVVHLDQKPLRCITKDLHFFFTASCHLDLTVVLCAIDKAKVLCCSNVYIHPEAKKKQAHYSTVRLQSLATNLAYWLFQVLLSELLQNDMIFGVIELQYKFLSFAEFIIVPVLIFSGLSTPGLLQALKNPWFLFFLKL